MTDRPNPPSSPIPPPGFTQPPAGPGLRKLELLPKRHAHVVLGVLQLLLGAACIALEVTDILQQKSASQPSVSLFVGVWLGGVVLLAGLFACLAGCRNSWCLAAVGLLVNIVAVFAAIAACWLTGLMVLNKVSNMSNMPNMSKMFKMGSLSSKMGSLSSGASQDSLFGFKKTIALLAISCVEIVLTAVHSCCSCWSVCSCCCSCCTCCARKEKEEEAEEDGHGRVEAIIRSVEKLQPQDASFEVTHF